MPTEHRVRGIVQVASRLTFNTTCSFSGCQRSVAKCSPACPAKQATCSTVSIAYNTVATPDTVGKKRIACVA